MRIDNNAYRFQIPARNGRSAANVSGGAGFGKQLDLSARENMDRCELGSAVPPGRVIESSPYCQLMDSYDAWKAQQPPQDLPASWGPTEENLAYLKDRYSGDLSWEERVDALETMVQMGVITQDQRNDAMGGGMKTFTPAGTHTIESITIESLPVLPDSTNWDESLKDYIASAFRTADDLFVWLDTILENETV